MKHTLRIATEASASQPILQSLNCLLRACVSQKVGYLVRITPPDTMAKFAQEVDEMLVDTVCELMQLEEVTPTQRELLLLPIAEGGWGIPSLNAIKECAFIGGTAATPFISNWEIPETYSEEFLENRTNQVRRAIERVKNDIGYDITEATKVKPAELARGGYKNVQKALSKLVKEKGQAFSRRPSRQSGSTGSKQEAVKKSAWEKEAPPQERLSG